MATASLAGAADTPRWWLDEPVRLIQTNLPETFSTLDSDRLVKQVAEFPANTLLFNMGGISAQYPTRVEFHYPSPYLPPGRDLFGEIVEKAHARGMRVVGRFDLSKTRKPVFDAHPEWFFRRENGEPAVYNGLYSACINGGYYREHAPKILAEALTRYPVDGLFFNMFGNPSADYSGRPMGPCQCGACRRAFRARFGRELPTTAQDADYRAFLDDSAREVAAMIAELVHRLRPHAAFLTYIGDHTDVIVHESNTSLTRPLPLWPYSASENVDRSRTSEPGKAVLNLCMSFVDYPWRFVTVPPPEVRLRLWQSLAHGGPPALAVVGTMDQEDRQSLVAARAVFEWHAAHESLYVGQQNAGRVLLLGGDDVAAFRGWFRLLTEEHIPFAVVGDPKRLDDVALAGAYDLVIATSGVGPGLGGYVRGGGRLLLAGGSVPPADLGLPGVVSTRPHTQGSWRVHDHALLPSLRDTNLLFLDGPYVELPPLEKPLLTLIPPAMFGPPEKVWADKVETTVPGLVLARLEAGEVACVPWDVGALYYRFSSHGHAGLMRDIVDHLLPRGRQLRTDAHPLVEMTVMRQPARRRSLVHFVNVSGHSDTAYFAPVPMSGIRVALAASFTRARAVMLGRNLTVTREGRARAFTLPRLGPYEVVVIED